MPQTYIDAVSPGAVGRTLPVAVSCRRSGGPPPGSSGTSTGAQGCMAANLRDRGRPGRDLDQTRPSAGSASVGRRSGTVATAPASRSSSTVVVVVTPTTVRTPAATSARTPEGESSTATHAAGATASRWQARRYPSGDGLPTATSSAVTTTSSASATPRTSSSTGRAQYRPALVTTASR